MTELLLENNSEAYFQYFQYNAKTFHIYRYKLAVLSSIVGISIGLILNQNILALLGFVIGMLIGYKYPYYQMIVQKKQEDLVRTYMFPTFLKNFLNILEINGNVYQTLRETIQYTDEPLKGAIQNLVQAVEDDKTQRPYREFAQYIGTQEAIQIMGVIYQFTTVGLDVAKLRKLNETVDKFQENKLNELITYKVVHLERYSNFPVVITLLYTMSFVGTLLYIHLNTVMDML